MSKQPRLEGWLWLQRWLGIGPLTVFAGYHLWVHWPALFGRDAWLYRAQTYSLGVRLGSVVLLLLVAHAVLGVTRALRTGRASTEQNHEVAPGAVLQWVSGALLAVFVVYHLTHVWPRPDGVGATLERSYQKLWGLLGQPVVLASYVLGCGVLACHLALGFVRALEPRLPDRLRSPLRYAVGILGFVLFVSYLQLVARFAAGAPFLPYAQLERDSPAAFLLQSPHASDARGSDQHVS
ncbi:MAG: hypothetical protein RL701_1896 [Pseudomonadota bacterium]|jgi:succinate dehydrogenase hydrophobic anchor subunit